MTDIDSTSILFELRQFTGDFERFRSIRPTLIYTPGVQYLAKQAGAYWLIDAIASYFPSDAFARATGKDERISYLHFWRLDVHEDRSATLTARVDKDEKPFITQEIEWTDFPLPAIDLWCGSGGKYFTLYLPSEH